MSKLNVLGALTIMAIATGSAFASVRYEADVFPEAAGWALVGDQDNPPVLVRSVQSGVFTISAAADAATNTSYYYELVNDSPSLTCEWSNRTSNDDGCSYMSIRFDWGQLLALSRANSIDLAYIPPDSDPDGMLFYLGSLSPGVFHAYSLIVESGSYNVLIDGDPVFSQLTGPPAGASVRVQFGFIKDWERIPTQSEWDYVRIIPTPEPGMALILACGFAYRATFRRRLLRHNGCG